MRRLVQQGLAPLDRLLNDNALSLQIVVTREKSRHVVEATLHARGEHFLHSAAADRDWELAVAAVLDKLGHQARKLKSRWTEGKRHGGSAAKAAPAAPRSEQTAQRTAERSRRPLLEEPESGPRIIRARRYAVKPMSLDEAAMEVGDGRDAFVVFRNSGTDAITVLFRRPDGHLGLIEPEA